MIILIGLLSNICFADDYELKTDSNPFNYNYMNINLDISGNLTVSGSTHTLSRLETRISQYPKESDYINYRFFNSNPDYKIDNNSIVFSYNNNEISDNLPYIIHSGLKVYKNHPKILRDPNFPMTNTPSEYSQYLQKTETIDINFEIRNKAAELVQNARGSFEAAFLIGKWVNQNVKYDATPFTESTVQKASWVYSEKKGVCDEITTLFIAMTRSVGLPGRFVSGVAYTDTTHDFGNHAWAEIYLGEEGWVPFDVTYGELGWIDSTHIPLSKTVDSVTNAVSASGYGNNVKLTPSKIDFNINLLDVGRHEFPDVTLSVDLLAKKISHDSYNIVEAEIYNNENSYLITDVYISDVTNLIIDGSNRKFVFLEPKRSTKFYWIIKTNESLDRKGLYKFPIHLYLRANKSVNIDFNVSDIWPTYSKSYVDNILEESIESELNEKSKFLNIECEPADFYIINENSTLNCELNNLNTNTLQNIKVCLKDYCNNINSIEGQDKKEISFPIIFNNVGIQTNVIEISNDLIMKKEYIHFNVVDIPKIKVTTSSPNTITFDEKLPLTVDVIIESLSRPEKMNISIIGPGNINKNWFFNKLNIDQKINLKISAKRLYANENTIYINFDWEDKLGRPQSYKKEVKVSLIDLNLWQKFYVFVNKLIN